MTIGIFLSGVVLLFFSGIITLPWARTRHGGERVTLVLVSAGSLLGLIATLLTLASGRTAALTLPWSLPGASFDLNLDPLAALFLLPVFIVTPLAALYGRGYWPQAQQPQNGPGLRLFFGTLTAALALVLTAKNTILFLVAWEIMALSSYFLITTESSKVDARRAGFLYLTMTHVGTLALFGVFILLGQECGSLTFPPAASIPAARGTAIFLLALFGFGIKAGLMPLHVWLPTAHAAAPSHISALLSGLIIKSGIYGLVRITGCFADLPLWWGWTILLLGAISGVLGVVLALAQHDLKRLLAYHSVENIGIIALGLGMALIGRASGRGDLAALGLAGALLHTVNHGLFKPLLFLGAGSVIHAVGSRTIDHCGGLLKSMPITGLCFLGGAVAISGLPPLNGFVSEWLIYLGLFGALEGTTLSVRLVVLAVPCLALIGGLALACFVKVFGVVFLGSGRTPATAQAHEAPGSMLVPMGLLLAVCALIGLAPALFAPALSRACNVWFGSAAPALSSGLAPLPWISLIALLLLALLGLLWFWQRGRSHARTRAATWGCGYTVPTQRMQYTASSFALILTDLFDWSLRKERHPAWVDTLFPPALTHATHTPDLCLDYGIRPLLRRCADGCTRLRALIQNGFLGFYLLYIALTLIALLIVAARLRGVT